jgi:hypothetical protein
MERLSEYRTIEGVGEGSMTNRERFVWFSEGETNQKESRGFDKKGCLRIWQFVVSFSFSFSTFH